MLLPFNPCPREEKQRNAHEGKVPRLCGSIDVVHIKEHVLDSPATRRKTKVVLPRRMEQNQSSGHALQRDGVR